MAFEKKSSGRFSDRMVHRGKWRNTAMNGLVQPLEYFILSVAQAAKEFSKWISNGGFCTTNDSAMAVRSGEALY